MLARGARGSVSTDIVTVVDGLSKLGLGAERAKCRQGLRAAADVYEALPVLLALRVSYKQGYGWRIGVEWAVKWLPDGSRRPETVWVETLVEEPERG